MTKPTLDERIETLLTLGTFPRTDWETKALSIINELRDLLTARVKEYIWLHDKSAEQAARIAELEKAGDRLRKAAMRESVKGELLNALNGWWIATGRKGKGRQYVN
jgi:hypothetical protein